MAPFWLLNCPGLIKGGLQNSLTVMPTNNVKMTSNCKSEETHNWDNILQWEPQSSLSYFRESCYPDLLLSVLSNSILLHSTLLQLINKFDSGHRPFNWWCDIDVSQFESPPPIDTPTHIHSCPQCCSLKHCC